LAAELDEFVQGHPDFLMLFAASNSGALATLSNQAVAKNILTVGQHGYSSGASIPRALDVGVRSGRVQKGQTLLLEGVGGGFTWGAVLLTL
jgi:3-oxoacyl-[acyl-carrier-protein] synthase III